MKNAFHYETKIGVIGIVENGEGITHLNLGRIKDSHVTLIETPLLRRAYEQLTEYLEQDRRVFDLPLITQGTEFQQKVWRALQCIPYGKTCSYKEIAEKVGNVKACRAVGMANNKNPIAIFIPCHRVIGANGKLVGYAGGLDIKEKLLELERVEKVELEDVFGSELTKKKSKWESP